MSQTEQPREYCYALVCTVEATPTTYTLETASQMVGIHPEMLRYYCQQGLLGEGRALAGTDLLFDDDAIFQLRRYEYFRKHHGISRQTLRLICSLWRELERLQAELRMRYE